MAPDIKLKSNKEEYYEGESVKGELKLTLKHVMKEFHIRVQIVKEESYVIYNEEGEQAISTKEDKRSIVEQQIKIGDPRKIGDHFFNFTMLLPEKIEAATFYHSGKTLSAKIAYKI